MTAIAYATLAVSVLSLIAWLVYGRVADVKALATERIAHSKTQTRAERGEFENAAIKSRLADSERMVTALQEVLADVQTNLDSSLPRGDVAARVRRAAAQAAADRAGAVASSPGAEVPASPAAAEPGTASVSAVVGLDDKLLATPD